MPKIYANAMAGTITSNPLLIGGTSITSANFANLPTVTAPDTLSLTLDPTGVAGSPEIVTVTAHTASSTTVTVTRASESTVARQHLVNTIWRHSATKADFDDLPHRLLTTTGDTLYASAANTPSRLAIGTHDGMAVMTSSGVPVWGDPTPAGTIRATIRATADTGWLLFNQTVINAQTLYPALWAVVPVAWQSGSSLVLPSLADRMLEGAGTTTNGVTGGANSKTIASANLPVHTHTVDPPNTSVTITDPGHLHTIPAGASGIGTAAFNGPTASGTVNTNTATTGITASVDIGSFSSGNGGFANTALDVTPAHLAVTFQIKAH